MSAKKIVVTVGAHADSVAGWLGSYGGQESPNDIQRGIFASEVGIPRLVKLFEREAIPATWFIPGHTIESFPSQMQLIVESGAEVACHGYSHENPVAMSAQQERDVLAKSVELVERLTGRRPRGYVAPWWEMSSRTAQLLIAEGFSYDNSQSYHDFEPFYARVGDSWTNVDYDLPAAEWMKPLVRGGAVDLVEFAANWYVDDLPPMMFIKGNANSHGYVSPQVIEQLWRDQFDWVYREMDYAVFPVTIHPDVSGRPQVLLMLERFFEYVRQFAGVEFLSFEDAADDFRVRSPFDPSRAVGE